MGGAGREFFEVVGDQDPGQVGMRRVDLVEGLEELLAGRDVEPGRRLVEEQETRVGDQRAGDQRPAALALGQRRPGRRGQGADAEQFDQLQSTRPLSRRRLPARHAFDGPGQTGENDVENVQRRPQRVSWVDVTDRLAELPDVDGAEAAAEDLDRAAGRVGDRAAQVEQRALPRAVRPEQRPSLTLADRQRHPTEQQLAVPDEVDVLQFEHPKTSSYNAFNSSALASRPVRSVCRCTCCANDLSCDADSRTPYAVSSTCAIPPFPD